MATTVTLASLSAPEPAENHFSTPTNVSVREEVGFSGARMQFTELAPANGPVNRAPATFPMPGGNFLAHTDAQTRQLADAYQQTSTTRGWAPSAAYPGQQRAGELRREVVPKNHQEFELVGRNIGPHNTANAVGGYVGMDKVGEDLTEKFTQRTFDDFKEYYNPHGPGRSEVGNSSYYNQFDQNRIEARELDFKNAPGRFPGAFRHDHRNPDSSQEKMQYNGYRGTNQKPTMKADEAATDRFVQRPDGEGPNRTGLRVQYSDIYSGEWNNFETLENHRRMQHTVEQQIDHTMIRPWSLNPYTPPVGIIPFSGQNATGLNTDMYK